MDPLFVVEVKVNINKTSCIMTIYNTVILVNSDIKFLDRHFLFIEKVPALLHLILFRALSWNKI